MHAVLWVSVVAPVMYAQPLEGDVQPCRRWKAVLPDLSPLGARVHLPSAWPTKGGFRRFSINADGVVAGSAEVIGDWTIGLITGLRGFCCQSNPVTLEELDLALALSGEVDLDTFRARAAGRDALELAASCASIHEALEAIRHATH